MIRIRGVLYLLGALVVLLILATFTSESFNLNYFLRPVPHTPPLQKFLAAQIQKINNDNVKASDPEVIRFLREDFLFPPSDQPYNLSEPEEYNPSMGQAQRVDVILHGKRNGFYIECGALDGELRSNTLYFERVRGWRGLLIEADPVNFEKMLTKNRRAYTSPACLAPATHPTTVLFQQQDNTGHIIGKFNHPGATKYAAGIVQVQCFPVYSFLLALNISTVDYFSLDVEGAEFSILQTVPWDKVNIKTLSVEFIHDYEGKEAIRSYMSTQGYVVHSEVTHPNWLANDFIFVKKSLLKQNARSIL